MGQFLQTITAVLVLTVTAAHAQSLADIARKEEERRKSVRAPGKVYTNDALRNEPPPSTAAPDQPATTPAQPAQPTPPAAAPRPAQGQAPAGQAPEAAPPALGEAEWRKRMATEREALSRAQLQADAFQSQINALDRDFVNTDDPAQRQGVADKRQKALAELDRVRKEIQQHQKAITDIQNEARRAGVPAGWVR